jgi:hypothetical protein
MITVVAFKPAHLDQLVLQEAQEYFGAEIAREGYADILRGGPAFTALAGDEVVACSGCLEIWDNRAAAWALVGKNAGRNMVSIHRAVSGFLLAAPWRRVEAAVDVGFEAGMRWIEMLGFQREAVMRAYRPDGGDSYLFARVKP